MALVRFGATHLEIEAFKCASGHCISTVATSSLNICSTEIESYNSDGNRAEIT